jgi:hypothetical protein
MQSVLDQPCSAGIAATLSFGPSRVRARTIQIGFVGLYVAVLAWFGLVDVWHNAFYTPGPIYLGYNLARVIFLAYLAWTQFFLGRCLLEYWRRRGAALKLNLLDEFILCFYAGAALLAGFVFLLGFLNLYYYWVFALGSVGLVAWSSAEAGPTLGVWRSALAAMLWRDRRTGRRLAVWLVFACLALTAGVLLVVKGLYPGGGHDYYTHYFPYYRHVLLSHGLWPNDVWYHFYYTKGATVKIASMVLTDMQAPETVTYLYILVASLCVVSLLHRWANNSIVPCLGMIACMAPLLWTEAIPEAVPAVPAWGHFQKHHEFAASLIMSVVWLSAVGMTGKGPKLKAGMMFLGLSVCHCVLHAPPMTPLLFAALMPVIGLALVRRHWGVFATALVGLGCATLTLAGILLLNYLITGLAEITPMRWFWNHANQERFSQRVSPYLMTLLLEGSSSDMGKVAVTDWRNLVPPAEHVKSLARANAVDRFLLDISGKKKYLLLAILVIIGLRFSTKKYLRFPVWRLATPVLGLFLGAILFSQLAAQPTSTFRSFSFMVFFVVLIALGVWIAFFRLLHVRRLTLMTSYWLPAVLAVTVTVPAVQAIPTHDLEETLGFALGQRSLAQGFRERSMTTFPHAIRTVIGHEPRVYSFDTNTYSIGPDGELESFMSFALHENYHEILFESPEHARTALQNQGLNYFLIDLSEEKTAYCGVYCMTSQ